MVECSHDDYARGYSTDVDTIREQEYPLLNGIDSSCPEVVKIMLTMALRRYNLPRPCWDNPLREVPDRVILTGPDVQSLWEPPLHVPVIAAIDAADR